MSISGISPTPGLCSCSYDQFTLGNRLSVVSLRFSPPYRTISLPVGGNFLGRPNFLVHFEPRTLLQKPQRLAFTFSARAADSTQPSSVSASPDKAVVTDDEFSLAKVRFWLSKLMNCWEYWQQTLLGSTWIGISLFCSMCCSGCKETRWDVLILLSRVLVLRVKI